VRAAEQRDACVEPHAPEGVVGGREERFEAPEAEDHLRLHEGCSSGDLVPQEPQLPVHVLGEGIDDRPTATGCRAAHADALAISSNYRSSQRITRTELGAGTRVTGRRLVQEAPLQTCRQPRPLAECMDLAASRRRRRRLALIEKLRDAAIEQPCAVNLGGNGLALLKGEAVVTPLVVIAAVEARVPPVAGHSHRLSSRVCHYVRGARKPSR
jgi:hypothetical protein